jgi:hypothetical protein
MEMAFTTKLNDYNICIWNEEDVSKAYTKEFVSCREHKKNLIGVF